MGTPLDSIFLHTKKISVTGLSIFGRSDHKWVRYDERSHDMIRSDRKKNYFCQKSDGKRNRFNFFDRSKIYLIRSSVPESHEKIVQNISKNYPYYF